MLNFKNAVISLFCAMAFAAPAHGKDVKVRRHEMSIGQYVRLIKSTVKSDIEKLTGCDARFVGDARQGRPTKCSRFASAREAAMIYLNIEIAKYPKDGGRLLKEIVGLFENLVKSEQGELTVENLASVGKICGGYIDVQFCFASFKTNAQNVADATVDLYGRGNEKAKIDGEDYSAATTEFEVR